VACSLEPMITSGHEPIRIEIQRDRDALIALGRVAANWTYYEQQLDLWLNVLLNRPEAEQFPKNLHIAFKRRLRLWRQLSKASHREPDKLKRIQEIISRSAKARDDRDSVVHGYWTLSGDIFMVSIANSKIQIKQRRMSTRYVSFCVLNRQ
jgi:hypothetical protein